MKAQTRMENPVTRSGRRWRLRHVCAVALGGTIGLGAVVSACGGSKPGPPHVPTAPADASAGTLVTTDAGQQTGIVVSPGANVDLSQDARAAYQKGADAFAAGDLTTAKAAFADAASKTTTSGVPSYSLGVVLDKLGDSDGATAAYKKAFDTDAKLTEAAGAYAISLAKAGKKSDADAFMSNLSAQNPDSTAYLADLAEVKSLEDDSTDAQSLAQQALKKDPNYAPAMLAIARDYFRHRRYEVALYALGAILDGSGSGGDAGTGDVPARAADSIEAKLLRGLIERSNGSRSAAMADLAVVATARPDMVEGVVALGELRLEASNATDALGPLQSAAKYAPNDPVVHNDLGDCYRLLNQATDAQREFNTALSLNSSFAAVHYNLGLLYLYGSNVPGVSTPVDQLNKAIAEFSTYKTMNGASAPRAGGEDVDALLSTAKDKLTAITPTTPPPAPASTDDSGASVSGAP